MTAIATLAASFSKILLLKSVTAKIFKIFPFENYYIYIIIIWYYVIS